MKNKLVDKKPAIGYSGAYILLKGQALEMLKKAAATLGSIKSKKKAASSRRNGLLGGRPRKTGK